ncbi:beta-1,3-glucanase family protein [Flavobacterium sp. PL02]|uniref:beta-1,3-glucanase family protein n=1 Tax=Flavobacterium sp. PL02 TaxID=3088354 RepID=UPI002B23EA95|nr:beta-1,3-glucanase family protein [Flavobacterium sp. PL02]MEA9414021.1 beta-1,3-glucanase family protein [Flavobacterium sp. PL02]
MRNFKLKKIPFITVLLFMLLSNFMYGQGPIPFTISNTSTFNDNELYVAIVGIDYTTGNHVWVNAKTSQVLPMSSSYNTVTGPTIGGNTGPGQNSKYANCFTKLSEIPNKTFTLPQIAGCRVFIAKGQQLYFYFFGANGAPSGYTSPNPLNVTDPNQGILYEIIELTNNQYGFFGNPSRVDSYKYPMGLELFGANGYQKRVGELKKHADIVAAFKANVPSQFQGCVNDATGEITAPSKTPAFADGTGGTTVGAQANYLKPYIDAIWNKYKTEDLIFYAGDAGVFKGRVIGEQLEMVGQSGGFIGRTGRVQYRPSTQEALEGKGVLDRRLVDGDLDLVIQAQLTAAINRHVVNVTTPNPGQQNWYDASKFYQVNPTNHYSKFWHLPGISVDNLAYGFAYDDVADQSPSLHTTQPTKVIAVFGGYGGSTPTTPSSILIQAENYSSMSGIQVEATTDTDGGSNVGYTDTGDWMAYNNNINFPTTGAYLIEYRVASAVNGAKISSDLNAGTIPLGNVTIPNTGGWQNWQTVSQTVNVNAGTYNFGIYIQSSGVNINWIKITKTGATARVASIDTKTEEPSSLIIYPSPVENTLFYTTDLAGGDVSIIDSQTGTAVSGQKSTDNSINVSHLKSGIYLIIFEKDGKKIVKRFIKK